MKSCAIKKHDTIHAKSPGTPIRISLTAKDMKYGHLMNWLNPVNIPIDTNKGKTKHPPPSK